MRHHTDIAPIADMIAVSQRAMIYATGIRAADLAVDVMRADALLRVISVLGEAANRVSEATRQRFPDIPWKEMRGMRNIIMHDYDHVEWSIVHEVATIHIPAMLPNLICVRDILIAEEPPLPEITDA